MLLMKKAFGILVLLFLFCGSLKAAPGLYAADSGVVTFRSEAPQELISATSRSLHGLIDTDKRTFAFRIPMRSFKGFNSGLQREHFNENYVESEKFPEATFRGKIIEQIDFTKDGKYTVRAKGIMSIHGIEQERIIKSDVTIQNGKIHVESKFFVLITDHDIKVPKVVHDKVASEIEVVMNADFKKKEQ
jgi:hypothetical protein